MPGDAFLVPGPERLGEGHDREPSPEHAGRQHSRFRQADHGNVEELACGPEAGIAESRNDGRVEIVLMLREDFKNLDAADQSLGAG